MKKLFLSILIFSYSISFSQEIKWLTIEEAVELSKQNPKKIYIKIYTDWCGWCKKMDKDTFLEKDVIDYMSKNYYCVKLNGEEKRDIVFEGKTYKFVSGGRNGYNEFSAAITQGKLSYPSNVFLTEKRELLQNVGGYIKPNEFIKISKYFGEDAYKTTSWEDYDK